MVFSAAVCEPKGGAPHTGGPCASITAQLRQLPSSLRPSRQMRTTVTSTLVCLRDRLVTLSPSRTLLCSFFLK